MDLTYTAQLPTEADLHKFYEALWNDFLKLSPQQLLTAMKQSFYSIYVYAGGELVATGRVVSDGVINAYICGVGVLPEHRGKGIGTEIMDRLKAHCLSQGLHVQFFCEEELVPFYEKIGFAKFACGMKLLLPDSL